jgi:hypothetical protein
MQALGTPARKSVKSMMDRFASASEGTPIGRSASENIITKVY